MNYNRGKLIDQLILHEGLRLQVYQDHLGIDTIGVGRNLEDRGITDGELAFMSLLKTKYTTRVLQKLMLVSFCLTT